MNPLIQILAILRKDLLLELRSKEVITSMLVFALTVVVIFNFVFDPGSTQMQATAPGILWVAFTFAGVLGLSRAFAREQEQGMMQGLLLCPIDRSLIYIAKVIGNVLFISVVELVTLPIMIVLFDLSVGKILPSLLLVLFLGTLGFAGVGTLFSTISANTKSREVMLPILLFPVSVPVILTSIKSTSYLLSGREFSAVWSWLRILMGFDVIFLVICFLLYEYVVEE
jgi:heme exporter protein B